MVDIAASLLADGIAIEAVLSGAADYAMPGLAAVLRRAWRIHVASAPARQALNRRAGEAVDERGTIHALA
jgi:hypothetical protein